MGIMTSVQQNNNLFPPSPDSFQETSDKLQLINPDLIQQIDQTLPDPPALVPNHDTPDEGEKFIPGKFLYVNDKYEREMLVNAWQAITNTETWNFLKEPNDSFMFSKDPRIWDITREMEKLGYYGHSGCSFGLTMRVMQYIAKHGEEQYMKEVLQSKQ